MKRRDHSAVLCLIVQHPMGIKTRMRVTAGDVLGESWWVFFTDRKSTMPKDFFEIDI